MVWAWSDERSIRNVLNRNSSICTIQLLCFCFLLSQPNKFAHLKLLAPLRNRSMSHQTNRNYNKTLKLEILSKLKKSQNWKILPSWDQKYVHPTPILGRETLCNRRFWHTVRVTPKQSMDPTNIIASYLQVWLLTLIWCTKCIFDILSFIVKILKLLFL